MSERNKDGQSPETYPCDEAIRERLMLLRNTPGPDDSRPWSNSKLASKIGCSTSIISQWLSPEGNCYPGDIKKWERSAEDFLRNEARRTASGVVTKQCEVSDQIRAAFELIRKTNDVGMILAEAGEGKTRAVELYVRENPTCVLFTVRSWAADKGSVEGELFKAVGSTGYDKQTKRSSFMAKRMMGSDRLVIVDDAHKLTRPALQWLFDFHDETNVPLGLVGIFDLEDKVEDDAQRHSRVGLRFEILPGDYRGLIEHIVATHGPKSGKDFNNLCDLCEQVAKKHGHFRAVHKQMKLTAELRAAEKDGINWTAAFRRAHMLLVRAYKLE